MLARTKTVAVLILLLLLSLYAYPCEGQTWIKVKGLNKEKIIEKIAESIDKEQPVNEPSMDYLKRDFQAKRHDANSLWEKKLFDLQHQKDRTAGELNIGMAQLLQLQANKDIRENEKELLVSQVKEFREIKQELDNRLETSIKEYRVVYNNYRRYYVVICKATIPQKEAMQLSEIAVIKRVSPKMVQEVQTRGIRSFVDSKELLISKEQHSFYQYIIEESHCVVGNLMPPKSFLEPVEENGIIESLNYWIIYAIYVQPNPEGREQAALLKLPDWDVDVKVVYDAHDSQATAGNFIGSPGENDIPSYLNDNLQKASTHVKSFVTGNELEEWRQRCVEYGEQIESIIDQIQNFARKIKDLMGTRAIVEETIASLGNEITDREERNKILRESYDKCKEQWAKHIINRELIFFDDEGIISPQVDMAPADAEKKLINSIFELYFSAATSQYLDAIEAYINRGGVEDYMKEVRYDSHPAQLIEFAPIYRAYIVSGNRMGIHLGIAIKFLMQLDRKFLVEKPLESKSFLRAQAKVRKGFITYNDIAYMIIEDGKKMSWGNANSLAQEARRERNYGISSWRLPTLGELQSIRYPDIESGRFVLFSELNIKATKDKAFYYWTQEEAGSDGWDIYYRVFHFGIDSSNIRRKLPSKNSAYVLLVANIE